MISLGLKSINRCFVLFPQTLSKPGEITNEILTLYYFQTNPYSAMREGGGGGGGGGGGADMSSWSAGALPPSAASYYSYEHPSLAYR